MSVLRVALHGAAGRMGLSLARVLAAPGQASLRLVGAVDRPERAGASLAALAGIAPGAFDGLALESDLDAVLERADVLIDFSLPGPAAGAFAACARRPTALVSGTTGLTAEADARLDALAAQAPVLHAPNFSAGVTLLFHLAAVAAAAAPELDAEIVELHHRHKVDAPSGTAVRLAEAVRGARGVPREAEVRARDGQAGPRGEGEVGVMTLRGGDVVGEHTLLLCGAGERVELTHRASDRLIFARGAVRAARWLARREPGRYRMSDVLGLG
ncbi:MAG: 4-hydroxy-tetrahydrodipicolinate reductase [Myxococcota bacterium]